MNININPSKLIYVFCPLCKTKAWLNDNHELHHDTSEVDHVDIKGILVAENIISQEEEKHLIQIIDEGNPWLESQEGRCKQDYGPKVNFLAKKASVGNFIGFPDFAKDILSRATIRYKEQLDDFVPVEFCILEYSPKRGSYIRPHYDDIWVWGDRLITVNLLSETTLRLTREFNIPPYEIAIRMPARSLIIIHDEARYEWHHSINKYDIRSRRVAMTWREFSNEIISDPKYKDFVETVFAIANGEKK